MSCRCRYTPAHYEYVRKRPSRRTRSLSFCGSRRLSVTAHRKAAVLSDGGTGVALFGVHTLAGGHAVEQRGHLVRGCLSAQRYHHGGNETEDKAGDDLIDTQILQQHQPADIHGGTKTLKKLFIEEKIPADLKIPHIGWNALDMTNEKSPLFKYIKDGDHVYFVHSYFAEKAIAECATSAEYGINFTASVWKDNIYGCQFHPEKSGDVGLNILRGFCEIGEN